MTSINDFRAVAYMDFLIYFSFAIFLTMLQKLFQYQFRSFTNPCISFTYVFFSSYAFFKVRFIVYQLKKHSYFCLYEASWRDAGFIWQ